MKLARYHRGDAYLPVETYLRGEQEVTLIGMMHVAPAAFFERVAELLAAYEARGDRILVEGIDLGDPLHAEWLSSFDMAQVRRYRRMRDSSQKVTRLVAEMTGMLCQLNAFPRWKEWERGDITGLELMRLRGLPPVADLPDGTEEILRRGLARPRVARWTYGFFRLVPALSSLLRPFRARGGKYSVILDHRNRVAMLSVLSSPASAVLPWGAAHLPGMATLLLGNGFELVSRSWLLALPRGGAA